MAQLNIVMVEPEIPPKTPENVARTCAATGARLHLVGPMGFTIDDKKLKRAGLDYWHLLDITYYENLEEFFEKNSYYLDEARKAGVSIAGTCSPYLTGWIPIKGEHFVTTESSMTTIGNSVWGACCNADGIEAAFWSAICGRTPEWGFHVAANRYGTHLIHIEADLAAEKDWELLGRVLGRLLPPTGSTPVIVGNFHDVDFVKLKVFLVAMSISSNCRMCHIVGITPEAPTVEAAFAGHPVEGGICGAGRRPAVRLRRNLR